jgi:hypothetical protein
LSTARFDRRIRSEQRWFGLGNHRGEGLLRGHQRNVFALRFSQWLRRPRRAEHRCRSRGGLWDQFVEQLCDSRVGVGVGQCRIGQQIIDFGAKSALLTRRYRVRTDRHIPPLCHLGNRAFPVSNLKLSL